MSKPGTTYEQLKHTLRAQLAKQLMSGGVHNGQSTLDRQQVIEHLQHTLNHLRIEGQKVTVGAHEQERLVGELADEVVGLGPLEPLLADPGITEIMINGPQQVYIERSGRLELAPTTFRDANHLMHVIERLLDMAGTSVTESEPCIDASLPDGSRVNVVIPPVVMNGPTVTIRKKARRWGMEDFLAEGSLSAQAAEFLAACVKARVNFVVSGGTSTAKTTLVSVLSAFISPHERVITIENVAELELIHRDHWIRLVARPHNIEGRGEVSLRMLVSNALRMRPDRIILGEARGGEAVDVVQAMHTGHEGVVTVMHANSPAAALERLSTLMLMSGLDIPPQVCKMQVASAVDVVVHLGRFADGSRRLESIAQVIGLAEQGFQLEPLFLFEMKGFRPDGVLEGQLRYTGAKPKFAHKFQMNNVEVPAWVTR